MKIKLICVGRIKDRRISDLINEYSGKINFDAKFEILEIRDSEVETEGSKIIEALEKIKDSRYVFCLSEEGTEFSSMQFSEKLKKLDANGLSIVLIIGGPFGLSKKVKEHSDSILSLSKMTMMHEHCRLFLLEQLYREISIIKNRNYHK